MRVGAAVGAALVLAWAGTGVSVAASPPFGAGTQLLLSGAGSLEAPLAQPVGPSVVRDEAVSADGRFVVFESRADGLSDEDDDARTNVFRKDLQTGAVVLVNRRDGLLGAADSSCRDAAISSDGARVVFECDGPLHPEDTDTSSDVYLRDVAAGQTFFVSAGAAEGSSRDASTDADGSHVAFESDAPLLAADTNGLTDVYVRSLSGLLRLISRVGTSGDPGNGDSGDPSLTGSATDVTFESEATNLVAGTSGRQVFYKSVTTGTATWLSRPTTGTGGVAEDPEYAKDARVVVFETAAPLVSTDTNGTTDAYRFAFVGGTLSRVSTGPGGQESTGAVSATAVSANGLAIAFRSTGTDLDAADTDPAASVFVRELDSSPTTALVSRRDGASGASFDVEDLDDEAAIDADGSVVTFGLEEDGGGTAEADLEQPQVLARDRTAGRTVLVSRPAGTAAFRNEVADAHIGRQGLSGDGRRAVLVVEPAEGGRTGVLRELATGELQTVARATGPDGAVDRAVERIAVSADGQTVAWTTGTRVDPARDDDEDADVYVRDLRTGTTELASVTESGTNALFSVRPDLELSADGRRVAFVTGGTLVAGVPPGEQAYVRDLAERRTLLASARDGQTAAGTGSVGPAVALDAAGRRVAFASTAADLVPGDAGGLDEDVFVRDLETRRTTLASARADGAQPGGVATSPDLSADGRTVVFLDAGGLVAPPPDKGEQVVAKDLVTGAVTLVSRASGSDGAPSDGKQLPPVVSADGSLVAFATTAAALGAPDGLVPVLRDLRAGTTVPLLAAPGGSALATETPEVGPNGLALSDDGACAATTARGASPVAAPVSPDFTYVALRAVRDGCAAPPAGPPPRSAAGAGAGAGGSAQPILDRLAPDVLAPRISRLRLVRSRLALTGRRAGTTLELDLSERADLRLAVARELPGRRVRGRCRPAPRRPRRGACVRLAPGRTLVRRAAGPGRVRVRLDGRVGGRALAPGTYRLSVAATDAAGNRATARPLRVVVVRR